MVVCSHGLSFLVTVYVLFHYMDIKILLRIFVSLVCNYECHATDILVHLL